MSSFIVDKKEYVKAAGLMYGIEESRRDNNRYFLDVCRKEFEHCYLLNVISVNQQYDDHVVPDENRYDAEFEAMRKLARRICESVTVGAPSPLTLPKLRLRLQHFFGSVLYQIDDEACSRAVSAWFYTCINNLYYSDIRAVDGWWGSVDILEELDNAA